MHYIMQDFEDIAPLHDETLLSQSVANRTFSPARSTSATRLRKGAHQEEQEGEAKHASPTFASSARRYSGGAGKEDEDVPRKRRAVSSTERAASPLLVPRRCSDVNTPAKRAKTLRDSK